MDENGTPIKYDDCSKYGVNSFYSSLFLDKTITVLYKCGKYYKNYSLFEEGVFKYGCYYVKVIGKHKMLNKTKLDENNIGWFSHIDIIDILKLNLKVRLITDCEYNSLIYDDLDLINVSEIFGGPMQMLYDYKMKCEQDKTERFKERIAIIKKLSNYVIQCCAQKNKIRVSIDDYDRDEDNHELSGSNPEYIKNVDKNDYFMRNLARIIPFIGLMLGQKFVML